MSQQLTFHSQTLTALSRRLQLHSRTPHASVAHYGSSPLMFQFHTPLRLSSKKQSSLPSTVQQCCSELTACLMVLQPVQGRFACSASGFSEAAHVKLPRGLLRGFWVQGSNAAQRILQAPCCRMAGSAVEEAAQLAALLGLGGLAARGHARQLPVHLRAGAGVHRLHPRLRLTVTLRACAWCCCLHARHWRCTDSSTSLRQAWHLKDSRAPCSRCDAAWHRKCSSKQVHQMAHPP